MSLARLLEFRLSPENPNTPLSAPAQWLYEALGIANSDSGIGVSEQTSIRFTTVYACVKVIAEGVAMLPLQVHRRTGRGKELATDRREYQLLNTAPNTEMTAFNWKLMAQTHLCLWGNHYCELERDGAGRVKGLWPLQPWQVQINRFGQLRGQFNYAVSMLGGGERYVSPDDMLHLRGLSWDGLKGLSPIQVARQAVGLGLAAEKFGAKFFGNGAHAGGFLLYPGKLTEKGTENLRKSFEDRHKGPENSGKISILEEGITWQQTTIPPDDAQFLQTRRFQREEIASMFRVPPHMVGILERSTNNNIEHQGMEFVAYTLMPWCTNWEQEVNLKLFGGGSDLLAKFQVKGLMRGDVATRTSGYIAGRQWGWLSPNDVREDEDMNPMQPTDGGDEYLRPLNMVVAGPETDDETEAGIQDPDAAQEPAEGDKPPKDVKRALDRIRKAHTRLFRDVVGRVVNFERHDSTRFTRRAQGALMPALTVLADTITHNADAIERELELHAAEVATRAAAWISEQADTIAAQEIDAALTMLQKLSPGAKQ